MPKQTFLNLSEEKKQKIITAAKAEFSRVPIQEASISNIIKDAGIPRGSFYQYFYDKEDIFLYIVNDLRNLTHEYMKKNLKNNNGDLIESFKVFFNDLLIELQDENNRNFHKNIFLNLNRKTENAIVSPFQVNEVPSQVHEFTSLIDMKQFNFKDTKTLFYALKIIMAVTISSVIEFFECNLAKEEIIKEYNTKLELLKNGFYNS